MATYPLALANFYTNDCFLCCGGHLANLLTFPPSSQDKDTGTVFLHFLCSLPHSSQKMDQASGEENEWIREMDALNSLFFTTIDIGWHWPLIEWHEGHLATNLSLILQLAAILIHRIWVSILWLLYLFN